MKIKILICINIFHIIIYKLFLSIIYSKSILYNWSYCFEFIYKQIHFIKINIFHIIIYKFIHSKYILPNGIIDSNYITIFHIIIYKLFF